MALRAMHHGRMLGLVVGALLCAGTLFPPIGYAGDTQIFIRYAGSGFDTATDPDGDGLPVGVYQTSGRGTFGRVHQSVSAEFVLDEAVECPEGYAIPVSLVYSAMTLTFADQSQLFGMSTQGWLCSNPDSGHYFGYVEGDYVNGIGRFEGKTGWWETTFDGYNLDPAVGYRSFRGELTGGLYE